MNLSASAPPLIPPSPRRQKNRRQEKDFFLALQAQQGEGKVVEGHEYVARPKPWLAKKHSSQPAGVIISTCAYPVLAGSEARYVSPLPKIAQRFWGEAG